ncbi:hypothetical protein STEG23_037691, partial [Scotinomys teguina]
ETGEAKDFRQTCLTVQVHLENPESLSIASLDLMILPVCANRNLMHWFIISSSDISQYDDIDDGHEHIPNAQ